MDYRGRNNLGDQIRNTVEDALDSMNFDQLNRDINDSVHRAIYEAKRCLNGEDRRDQGPDPNNNYGPGYQDGYTEYNRNNDRANRWNERQERHHQRSHRNTDWSFGNYRSGGYRYGGNRRDERRVVAPYTLSSPPGKVSGIVCQVFGYLGTTSFGIAIFVLALLAGLSIAPGVLGTIAWSLSPLLVLSILLVARGNNITKRVKRYRKYCDTLGTQSFCDIKQFEQCTGKSNKFIIKDLKMMIHKGMFPQGHLDDDNTCFIVDNETYKQYLNAKEHLSEQMQEQQKNQEQEKKKEELSELERVMEEGRNYINQINLANARIPGEEISNKLARLETIISKIFDCVKEHPEQLPELRKFMDYYLPTTLKLVKAYEDFDSQPIQGDNIKKGKEEIGKTLDTINYAFETLLDSLYENATMEVSSDISVLKTLLAGDGLTKKDFNVK